MILTQHKKRWQYEIIIIYLLFNWTSYQFIRSVARSLATLHLQISFTCKTAFPAIIKTQSEPSLSGGSFEECCRWGSGRRWSSAGKPVKNWHTRGPDGLGTRKLKSEDEPQVEEPSEIHKAWRGQWKLWEARRGPRRGSSISLDTPPSLWPTESGARGMKSLTFGLASHSRLQWRLVYQLLTCNNIHLLSKLHHCKPLPQV